MHAMLHLRGPNGKTTHVSGLLTGAEYMTDSCRVKAIIASFTGIYASEPVKPQFRN